MNIFSAALPPHAIFFFSPAACCVLTSPQMTVCSCSFNLLPCLSFLSLSLSLVNIRTQAPNAETPSSLPVLCLPPPLPGCTLDRYQSLPLSPTSLTSNLPSSPLLSSNPLPQSTLSLFTSAPPLPNPTSNAPFRCTFSPTSSFPNVRRH